jgi:hypothetical protein
MTSGACAVMLHLGLREFLPLVLGGVIGWALRGLVRR